MARPQEYERVSLVKQEVFVYQIPPRASNRAVRAAEWNLANPEWRGRMRIVTKGDKCFIKLEDKISGELFALCPVDAFPGLAVEPVSDSSRYFVLRLEDPSGQHAFVGLGFEDRGDAFDLNVALQDHFKSVRQSHQLAQEKTNPVPHKDYSLKEGQKIRINLGKAMHESDDSEDSKPKSAPTVGLGPGGGLLPPPSSGHIRPVNPPPYQQPSAPQQQQQQSSSGGDEWGEFASFRAESQSSTGQNNWVQF